MLHQLPVHHLPPVERPRGALRLILAQYHAKQKEKFKHGVDLHQYASIDAIVGLLVRRHVERWSGAGQDKYCLRRLSRGFGRKPEIPRLAWKPGKS